MEPQLVAHHARNRAAVGEKRVANSAQSPILTALAEISNGSAVIRAHGFDAHFVRRTDCFIEDWAGHHFVHKALLSCGTQAAGLVACSLSACAVFFIIATREDRSTERAGLDITYCLVIPCVDPSRRGC